MDGSIHRKRVVIVGGGVGGALVAKTLQHHADVVLIDPKEYFEIPWAQLRSAVEPSFAERAIVTHTDYFHNGRVIVSRAADVTDHDVVTTEGRCIAYDYLVIATGHIDSTPRDRPSRLKQFQEDYVKIQSANSILVIGGGPTGVELAAEIAADFPQKKVTLVHNGPRLLEFLGTKASSKALEWLTSKRVDVLLDQSVNLESRSDGDRTYETTAGETVVADCHFLCRGRPLGSSWMKGTMLKDSLDSDGRLEVDEFLRVKGQKKIFAVGDITNVPEIKQGYFAQRHALVVAKNLRMLIRGGKEHKMGSYKQGSVMAMVSLGRRDALAQFPLTTVIGLIPGMIKSKDLFVGKTRRQMGLESHGH
ncbi:uncharacterized protein LOC131235523 [Magnolia sinica]|uniref:uncharacterized protein LOC131235523 n=1 Tax=Magnolia sinica TaxID=86752 RepID=UPI00265A63BE|nr:uncharacterized protein LOC131235523 [Magnolia sinica]